MSRESLTPNKMKLNEVEPEGFCDTPRSLFHEVTRLREAVLKLCDVVKEIDIKVENQYELLEGLGKIVGNVIDVLPLKTDKPTDGETP